MEKNLTLTEAQTDRYSRQIILKEIGGKGMKKLLNAKVAIVGAGGLGCPAAQVLAAAGVGKLVIIDGDKIELSNLPRQFLHHTADIGRFKADSIRDKIQLMNPDVEVAAVREFVRPENAQSLLAGADYVIEASDNQATKFLLNDACIHFKIPFSIAGVVQFYGQVLSVEPGKTRCLRCLFKAPFHEGQGMDCAGAGVIGTAPAFAGTMEANEAIKSILGLKRGFLDRLFVFSLLENSYEFLNIATIASCTACLKQQEPYYLEFDYQGFMNQRCDTQRI